MNSEIQAALERVWEYIERVESLEKERDMWQKRCERLMSWAPAMETVRALLDVASWAKRYVRASQSIDGDLSFRSEPDDVLYNRQEEAWGYLCRWLGADDLEPEEMTPEEMTQADTYRGLLEEVAP